ncbi:MAG: hypothetical protein ABMB14_34415, partial [Myxococcota bacterium]
MIALLAVSGALAQQTCVDPLSRIQLGAALGRIGDELAVSELVEAREQLDLLYEKLPCLDEVIDPKLFALFARYDALVFFFGQEDDEALRWGLAARFAAPDLPWDAALFPPDNRVRRMVEQAPQSAPMPLEGKVFDVPHGGGAFVNGLFAPEAEGHPDIPVLIQRFDRNGQRIDASWQDGAHLPTALLVSRSEPTPIPTWWSGPGATGTTSGRAPLTAGTAPAPRPP